MGMRVRRFDFGDWNCLNDFVIQGGSQVKKDRPFLSGLTMNEH